jgi:hypothetical protein
MSTTTASPVRVSFAQSVTQVLLDVYCKGRTQDQVRVSLNDHQVLEVRIQSPEVQWSETYSLCFPVNKMTLSITPYKIAIELDKQMAATWPKFVQTLEESKAAVAACPAYPTSNMKGRQTDWTAIEHAERKEEEEEPRTGDQALNHMFSKIFADGDDNMRRAMNKSYQTSGGTVLSTNWSEVSEKDYAKESLEKKKDERV